MTCGLAPAWTYAEEKAYATKEAPFNASTTLAAKTVFPNPGGPCIQRTLPVGLSEDFAVCQERYAG